MRWRFFKAGLSAAFIAMHIGAACAADSLKPGEHWFPATLDHRDAELTVLLYQPPAADGPLFRVLDLDALGIPYVAANPYRHRAENYVRADALTRHEAHVDLVMQRVHFVRKVRPHWPKGLSDMLLLDVRINATMSETPVFATVTETDIFLSEDTLKQLRINVPEAYGPFLDEGMPVHALAGENFYIDFERLFLEMTVPAAQFTGTVLHVEPDASASVVSDASPSLIFGYHASGGRDALGENWYSAVGDLTLSAGRYSCRSQHLARSDDENVRRLESACIADWPGIPLSAGVGDHFSMPGAMGETVFYGGAWVGTDYSLQPYRNLQPTLFVDGYARLPSTLEIWMDQQLGLRETIPPGPFVVERLPAVTGSGELQAVLVDATGRQVVLSTPVYSDPRLIQPGVVDWRVESGRLRGGIFAADEYGEQFASASARFGVTDWLTAEVHAERSADIANGTIAGAVRLWRLGLIEFGAGRSRLRETGIEGESELLGYSWRGDRLHVSYRELRRDNGYVSLGYLQPGAAPVRERSASIGFSFGVVNLHLAAIERQYSDPQAGHQIGTAAVAIPVGRLAQLRLTARQNLTVEGSEPVYAAYLSIPLGGQRHGFISVDDLRADDPATSIAVSQSPPAGIGLGYRIQRNTIADTERYYAEMTWRGGAGTATLLASRYGGELLPGARVSGAVVASRAGVGFARDDGRSFGMVQLEEGIEGVTIERDNLPVGQTDDDGTLIVPGLRPYQENRLRLRPEDVPLAGAITREELVVVPGRRGVVVADFGVSLRARISGTLQLAGGSHPPAGGVLYVNGKEAGLVGYDGVVYFEVADAGWVPLRVEWPGASCTATVHVPENRGFHQAGRISCRNE